MDQNTPTDDVSAAAAAEPESLAVAVPYDEFKAGLPVGRFRLIVNPDRAYRYVRHRLYLNGISIPLLGTGVALGLVGYLIPGTLFCAIGFGLRWFVKKEAAKILLHLIQNDAKVYYESIEFEIMEVRLAQD
jgi:hypothetical protein